MRDYAELVKALRTCKLSIPCTECPFYSNGDEPSKECATMNVAAADAIEELLAAVPKWISVEDELPEIERSVLLFNGAVHIGWRVDGKRFRFLSDRYPDHPTHWMPLPRAPKEVEGDA